MKHAFTWVAAVFVPTIIFMPVEASAQALAVAGCPNQRTQEPVVALAPTLRSAALWQPNILSIRLGTSDADAVGANLSSIHPSHAPPQTNDRLSGWAVLAVSEVAYGGAGYVTGLIAENAFGASRWGWTSIGLGLGVLNTVGYCWFKGCHW